jgi:hypothetical protein
VAPEILLLRIKVHPSGDKYSSAEKIRILATAGHLKPADLKTLDEAIRAFLSD